MINEEAVSILGRLRHSESKWPGTEDTVDALDMAVAILSSSPSDSQKTEPLTKSDLAQMHFERVWIDYGLDETGERCGEEGVVLYGRLYSIDALEGAGFEELLLDAMSGETLDHPTGTYTVYRRPTNGKEIEGCHD